MNDTSPEVEARLDVLFAQRTGSERVRMMSEMFALARTLMISNIRAEHPDISDAELKAAHDAILAGKAVDLRRAWRTADPAPLGEVSNPKRNTNPIGNYTKYGTNDHVGAGMQSCPSTLGAKLTFEKVQNL